MIAPPLQLMRAGLSSAVCASAAFALVFFVFLLFTPGDAGLSAGSAVIMGIFSVFAGIVAFIGFLPGVFTIGILAYAALDRLNRTGPLWAAMTGAVLAGPLTWILVGGSMSLTGAALGVAGVIGGGVGGLIFRQLARV